MLITAVASLTAVADDAARWVDSVYNSLTPRQRVAQLVIPHLIIEDNPAGRDKLLKLIRDDGVGGFLLGAGTVADYTALNRLAVENAAVPPLITADAEWGLAMRLKDAPRFPQNLALGSGSDLKAMEDYGREMARECRRLGITVSFAPDADVNSNPLNPVIGYRSLGQDPERVAQLAKAYARGLESGGVMAVAKHFPGHGDTSSDSHKTLPAVNRPADLIESTDLVPFQTLIDDGIGGIMTGHLNVPALDSSGLPASLSRKITTGLLKGRMGFDGLVFTDALEMKGARMPDGSNNCVGALLAGADVLLCPLSPRADIEAVMAAIKDGRLPQERIEASVRKVLTHKYYLTVANPLSVKGGPLANDATAAVGRRLARMSMTVVRNDASLLPLNRSGRVAVVSVGGTGLAFVNSLKSFIPGAKVVNAEKAGEYDVVVVPVMSSKKAAVAEFERIIRICGPGRAVPVFFINPYRLRPYAGALADVKTLVIAGDETPETRTEAAGALVGAYSVKGRMPVTVKGVAATGDGVDVGGGNHGSGLSAMSAAIDSLIDRGLSTGAFPGCQVMVVKDGKTLFNRSAGYISSEKKQRVTDATLYDLASVSKVAGTLLATMATIDHGLISPSNLLRDIIPAAGNTDKGTLTVSGLMTHRTGLPPSINAYRLAMDTATYEAPLFSKRRDDTHDIMVEPGLWGNRDARLRGDLFAYEHSARHPLRVADGIWATASATDTIRDHILYKVAAETSQRYRYSCLNYILLAEALKKATGKRLDMWLDEAIYKPMALDRILFQPLDRFPKSEIAATEHDQMLRRQTVHGTVHDETAAISGGIQGNAGLFANAASLAAIGQMLADGGMYDGKRILSQKTVSGMLRSHTGFDTNGNGRWAGHTGFTGTCMWIDPEQKIVVVVLTNRVNPSRDNRAFRSLNFRNAVVSAVERAYPAL